MRVLVLHPSSSSASTLHTTLSKLEERLWTQHGIELVFVDGPLLDVTVGRSLGCSDNGSGDDNDGKGGDGGGGVGSDESGLNEIEEGEIMSRRWYVEEECINERRTLVDDDNNADNNNNDDSSNNNNSAPQHTIKKKKKVQYSGLDASLLHLTQIWSRGGASSSGSNNEPCLQLPFQGILGFGQGANIAAMLPLLNHAGDAYNINHGDDDDDEEEEEEEITMERNKKCIFEGLQFVIFVDGRDIMNQEDDNDSSCVNNNNNGDEEEEEEEEDSWYVGPNGISSLHLIVETTTTSNSTTKNDNKRQSELLAKRYGPNATIQYYKPNTKKTNKSPSSSTTQQYNTPSLHNLLGHHLVLQKKTLLSNPTSRKLLSLQTQLYTVEQLATIAITNEIKMNPPKCLMAMIGPSVGGSGSGGKENCQNDDNDDMKKKQDEEKMNSSEEQEVQIVEKAVGAWQGPGRVFGEQGGGAPCPESFLLRQEDRLVGAGAASSSSSDGGDNKKSSVTVTASLL